MVGEGVKGGREAEGESRKVGAWEGGRARTGGREGPNERAGGRGREERGGRTERGSEVGREELKRKEGGRKGGTAEGTDCVGR